MSLIVAEVAPGHCGAWHWVQPFFCWCALGLCRRGLTAKHENIVKKNIAEPRDSNAWTVKRFVSGCPLFVSNVPCHLFFCQVNKPLQSICKDAYSAVLFAKGWLLTPNLPVNGMRLRSLLSKRIFPRLVHPNRCLVLWAICWRYGRLLCISSSKVTGWTGEPKNHSVWFSKLMQASWFLTSRGNTLDRERM